MRAKNNDRGCSRRPRAGQSGIGWKACCWLLASGLFVSPNVWAGPANGLIDACEYSSDAQAQATWKALWGTAAVTVGEWEGRRGIRCPCNFSGSQIERGAWDRTVTLDLSPCQGVQFEFYCRDAAAIGQFSIYFQSGDGWYSSSFYPKTLKGWQLVTIDKASVRSEGSPRGWHDISTIRFSGWRARDVDGEFCVRQIRCRGVLGGDAEIAIIRQEENAGGSPEDARESARYAETVAQFLGDLHLNAAMIPDRDVTRELLGKASLVVLPYQPNLAREAIEPLREYLRAGGKLISFYGVPPAIESLIPIGKGQFVREARPGNFATMKFDTNELRGVSDAVRQASWNIRSFPGVPGKSQVLAKWLDDRGQPTGHTALVGTTNCLVMSHVLLPDDPENKKLMLLAMASHLVPTIGQRAAEKAIAELGQIGRYSGFDEAIQELRVAGQGKAPVMAALDQAVRLRASAMAELQQGRPMNAFRPTFNCRQLLLEAFCRVQSPASNEFRSFWCHSADGVAGKNWDEAIKVLDDHGFQGILPNMLWGGVTFGRSSHLPVADPNHDRIAECLTACRRHGLEMHVWKVNWNLGNRVPAEFVTRLRREHRLQADVKGNELLWLCPSHPVNQQLEIDSMLEVAGNYEVDGLHFDYIRYPDATHCYCAGCRQRFENATGRPVMRFPEDVSRGGNRWSEWLDWRRTNITFVVKNVSERARTIRPGMKLSAAVFRDWQHDRDSVGQDWSLWCREGYLDFVCPMNYTASAVQFSAWIEQQRNWAEKVPVYPGIGASASNVALSPDEVIGQILIARDRGMRGFTIFNYGVREAEQLVPWLGLGISSPNHERN